MTAKGEYKIQSIARAVAIVDAISASPRHLSLREVTAAMGLHKSTAYRLLKVLEGCGLLEVSDRGLWRLGAKCERWANAAAR